MSSARASFSVQTENLGGATVIKVVGQFVNNRSRRTFNRSVDALAPCRARTDYNRVYVADLRAVTEMGRNGYDALEYASSRFRFCGARKFACCANVSGPPFEGSGRTELVRYAKLFHDVESALNHFESQ